MLAAGEASHMRPDDDVIGLVMNGEARAYPWWVLDNHHVANDLVGGRPVVISMCEMCSSALAFDPVLDGRRLIFKVTHVYMGTTAFTDRQTKSVWSPYFGRAITGTLRGRSLELLPAQQMHWDVWQRRHPDTLVLPGYLGSRRGHGSGHTLGSPQLSPDMRATVPRWDNRLPHNALVLGVVMGDRQRAYTMDLLRSHGGVMNDRLAGMPIVVLADVAPGSAGALAFRREVGGRTLTFRPSDEGTTDEQTGSRWTVEGVATHGPLAGERLPFVESHVSEWFIWAAHFPQIELAAGHDLPNALDEIDRPESKEA